MTHISNDFKQFVITVSTFVLSPLVLGIFLRNSICAKGRAFTKSRTACLYTYLQCNFNVFILLFCFVFLKFKKMRTIRLHLDTIHGARVHETSLCVTSAASRVGTNFRALSRGLKKYVMFSITFDTPALHTPMCVASGARRVCDSWSA